MANDLMLAVLKETKASVVTRNRILNPNNPNKLLKKLFLAV